MRHCGGLDPYLLNELMDGIALTRHENYSKIKKKKHLSYYIKQSL